MVTGAPTGVLRPATSSGAGCGLLDAPSISLARSTAFPGLMAPESRMLGASSGRRSQDGRKTIALSKRRNKEE